MAEDEQPNEIIAAAKDAKERRERAGNRDKAGVPLTAIGIGLGIGSAALAAALLYANRDRRKD